MSYESVKITVQPATVENVGILSYPVRELVTVNVTPPSTITSNTWGSIVGTLSSQTDLQTALNLKANLSGPTFTGTVTLPSTTSIGNVSATEIGYVDGVTSAIQTQLNAKAPIASPSFTGTVTATHIEGKVTGTELYCKAGQAIGAGQVVYVTGASGQNIIIGLAKADVESTSSKTIGVCQDALANNGFGYVVTEGKMVVSISASTANEGDPIWLSPTTAGGMLFGAANKPSGPDHIVYLGVVTRKTGSTVVEILVKVQNGAELDELSDVAITSPVSGQALMRGATLWTNRSLVIADITDATTYVPFLAAASNTFTGLASFTSTTRPTSSGTGTPAATSLITKADGDAQFGSFLGIPVTQASTAAWGGAALGLLPFATGRPDTTTSSYISTFGSSPPDVRFIPFWVPSTRTITSAVLKIISGTNATQTIRGALYDAGADGMPNNRVGSQFSWSAAATGLITASTGSISLSKGLYWLALQNSVGSTTWGGTLIVLGYSAGSFGLTSALLGTPASGWDIYSAGAFPTASGDASMPVLGANFSNKGTTNASSQIHPAVLLK